ncbi:Gas vesicle synthesis protein GvpL/GvpF [Actinacidiphila yanglinensis]|uniref:Gas vesicle synthesis protein GvpL/GvpF n=1 Tax=Actinacidiphila yanglinensis TaxID=310779 RepID=A0A1H6ECW6_9ACTN|nr:GvpL/GvpF family gas vesicle protein [Actinacidiphila yanglinensis]SEG95640.1 Gas vesicle synthesis protein GvpL/GvpF [Actinacidiphila yanglinensis]
MSIYVYGVTRAPVDLPAGLRGVGDPPSPLRALAAGSLAAVVSAAPERLRARRRDLHAHQNVLLALAEEGPVLPSRFGVVAADAESVDARLRAEQDSYEAALDRVAGRVEMNLKALTVESGLNDLLRQDPRLQRFRQEARRQPGYETSIRLGEAVMAGLTRRARAAVDEGVTALTPLAAEVQPGPEVEGCVRNTSFLVAADQVPEFRRVVEEFASRHSGEVELRVTGPLPCYSFAALPAAAGA